MTMSTSKEEEDILKQTMSEESYAEKRGRRKVETQSRKEIA